MIQCTKCKVEKELDQFQRYWHSTQQKHRIRKECTECLYKQRNERKRLKRLENLKLIQVSIKEEIVQPVVPELEPEVSIDYSTNKDYKQCRTCQEYVHKDKFYHHKSRIRTTYLDCKSCINKKEAIRAKKDREKELEKNGGSFQHKVNPGEWIDEYQKKATYNILKSLGWKLNEENGIWWKEGIKTPDGVFINVKTKGKTNKKYIFGEYPEIIRTEKKKEMYDKMVQLRLDGYTYKDIGYKFGISETTAHKWLTK